MSDPSALPFFPPPPDEHPLRGRVLDALIDMQLQPEVDADGDVVLRVKEQNVFCRCVDSTPPLMRVFGQWTTEDLGGVAELTLLKAANVVSASMNLVKVTVHGSSIAVAADLIIGDDMNLGALTSATVDAVLSGAQGFYTVVRELSAEAEGGAPDGEAPDGGQQGE